jgi:organic radical activating enzyme
MTSNQNANIIEIFSSIQGEGNYIGYRQLFIRFALCNLNCSYCDTEFEPQKFCKIEKKPATGIFAENFNPVSTGDLINIVNDFSDFNHHSISLTGGEPLMQSDFLKEFLSGFKFQKINKNIKIYLETNGTLPDELNNLINLIDIISMDIKLQSSTKNPVPWEKHNQFIDIAKFKHKDIFAKVVVTDKITANEIEDLVEFICNKQIPLIIQPVNSNNKDIVPSSQKLLSIQESMLKKLTDVRIIPQVHKYLNLL